MKLIHLRGRGGSRDQKKVAAGAVDSGSNSRQVAPDDVLIPFETTAGYASSRDEAFFEASPWLDSDCEDDFFSVNGDATPARTFISSAASCQAAAVIQKLPTLEAILKAEPLKPPPAPAPQQVKKLGDFLKEKQEGVDAAPDGLSGAAGSSRAGDEASGCCIPRLARAISYKERRKRKLKIMD